MLTNGWYKWKDSEDEQEGLLMLFLPTCRVKLAEKSSVFQRMDLVRVCIFSSLCGSGKTNTMEYEGLRKGLRLFSSMHLLLSETTILLPL